MLFNRFDSYVGRSFDLYGEYCEAEAALLRSLLRPGQLLCANLALNELVNVDARQAGLGSAPGTVSLPVVSPNQEFNFGGMPLTGHRTGETVAIETIDAIGLKTCRLIKADVEGMEREVLLGAEATIGRCRPIQFGAPLAADHGWRYRAWWDRPPLYSPGNFARNAKYIFPKVHSRNIFCVPEELPIATQATPIASSEEWIK